MDKLKIVVILLILFLGLFVALSPGLVYAPTPRVILYFLVSFLPGLLFGAEVASKFDLKMPGFCFTTAGACAICFGALVLLTNLSKPEQKIAVYQIYDQKREPLQLDWSGALTVPVTAEGFTVTKFVEGNSVILVFPEQIGEVDLVVKETSGGPSYVGKVGYTGTRTSKLYLGDQLKKDTP